MHFSTKMDKIIRYYLTGMLVIVFGSNCIADSQCKHQCIYNNTHTCNYKKIGDTCYYLFKGIQRNWNKSRELCEEQGMSMAIINRHIQQNPNYILDLFNDTLSIYKDPQAWLGGRANDLASWTFVNGDVVTRPGLQMSATVDELELCGVLEQKNNILITGVQRCHDRTSFLCQKTPCPENEECLILKQEEKTWFEARSYCIDSGGDLFYLNKSETLKYLNNSLLYRQILNQTMSGKLYIGIIHALWKWNDGTEIFHTNWKPNEPNSRHDKCLTLNGNDGKWNDEFCSSSKIPFCQKEISDKTTVAYDPSSESNSNLKLTPPVISTTLPLPSSTIQMVKCSMQEGEWYCSKELIILASLLGLFFLIIVALIIVIICMKHKCRKKSDIDDTVIVDNDYYESSAQPRHRSPVTASTPRYTNPPESTVEYSYDASLATQSNGSIHQTAEKPVIKPKPIIGPHGDVYSTVEKPARLPIKPTTNGQYVNTS